jgi:hypothetical protein
MVCSALAVIAIARLYHEGAMGVVRRLVRWISGRKQAREGVT